MDDLEKRKEKVRKTITGTYKSPDPNSAPFFKQTQEYIATQMGVQLDSGSPVLTDDTLRDLSNLLLEASSKIASAVEMNEKDKRYGQTASTMATVLAELLTLSVTENVRLLELGLVHKFIIKHTQLEVLAEELRTKQTPLYEEYYRKYFND